MPVTERPASAAPEIRVYDPARSANGYTLILVRRRQPALIDMHGRVVHAWPEIKVKSRARLERDGSLLALTRGGHLVRYSWGGELLFEYRFDDAFAHHDVIRLANGNVMTIIRRDGQPFDALVEIDPGGEMVWEWKIEEHLDLRQAVREHPGDATHVNSVQELPPNPLADPRFRPGNLLISARNTSQLHVIDRESGAVTWSFGERLDFQHEALLIPGGFARAGHITVLSNGYRGRYGARQSAVVEIDPAAGEAGEVVWEYRPKGFYTRTGGLVQPLPNGNLLIVSEHGGRIFEVTRNEDVVWQWVGSYKPTRPWRYEADHCPQLAALEKPRLAAVAAPAGDLHVDPPLYRFAYDGARHAERIAGERRQVLKRNAMCRPLLIPARPSLELACGVRRESQPAPVRCRVTGRDLERKGSIPSELWSVEIGLDGEPWRGAILDLAPLEHRTVELCVEAMIAGPGGDEVASPEMAWWQNPRIESGTRASTGEDASAEEEELTAEEREARRKHLEALGYVD